VWRQFSKWNVTAQTITQYVTKWQTYCPAFFEKCFYTRPDHVRRKIYTVCNNSCIASKNSSPYDINFRHYSKINMECRCLTISACVKHLGWKVMERSRHADYSLMSHSTQCVSFPGKQMYQPDDISKSIVEATVSQHFIKWL